MIVDGSSGATNQTVLICAITIFVKFRDPAIAMTGRSTRLMDTSYEIICAADRSAPRNAYLELLAQPAIINP